MLMSLSGPVAGQQQTPSSSVSVSTAAKQIPETSSTEIKVLKAQLEMIQSYTDRLLTTVYWSLGAVFVIASLLVGFGWFTSIRLHERDISAIRTELTGVFGSQLAAIRTELEKLVQDQIENLTKSSAEAANAAVSKQAKPIQGDVKNLQESCRNLYKQLAYLEFQSEAWYWEIKGVKSNEIMKYIEILRLAIEDKNSHRISRTLKEIEELLRERATVFTTTITSVTALLDSLSPEHAIQAASLREALRSAKTY
jgi:hypothetical protein